MVIKEIKFTDWGTEVKVQSEILIDGLPNRVLDICYDYGTFRQAVKDSLRNTGIHTVVSHEPFFGEVEQQQIKEGKPVEVIIQEQRLRDGEDFHIDDFGFYVYLHHSFCEGYDTLDDTRYEKIKPPGT